jgi:SAM-dependent methyltransferase
VRLMVIELASERLEQIYAEYRTIAYPHLLVDEARRCAGREGDLEFAYGTTPASTVLQLLEFGGATADDVFYDLGCGLGVPTIVAAHFCKRSIGIEILPEVAEKAREVAQGLSIENAVFELADFKSADVSQGTLIYCYSTCLRAQSRAELAEGVSRARPGTRILTVTHNLEHAALELKEQRQLSWEGSEHTVYLHLRR